MPYYAGGGGGEAMLGHAHHLTFSADLIHSCYDCLEKGRRS